MTTQPTPEQVLAVEMPQPNDAGAHTIRDYLVSLLAEVWRALDDFSAKRPFGNSGWNWDLYRALAEAGHITGFMDDEGYLDNADDVTGDRLIAAAIEHLRVSSS